MTGRADRDRGGAGARKRSKVVRWQGLLIFVVLVALVSGLWLLFVDRYAERTIESAGTSIVGAKVELDQADVSLSPLGLTLVGLKVTTPDAPMTNAFEAGRIAFHMDGPNALRRKVIIEEMSVDDVRLNTPRKTSGAVASTGKTPLEQLAELPSFVIPNVKEAFEKEKADLRSLKIVTGPRRTRRRRGRAGRPSSRSSKPRPTSRNTKSARGAQGQGRQGHGRQPDRWIRRPHRLPKGGQSRHPDRLRSQEAVHRRLVRPAEDRRRRPGRGPGRCPPHHRQVLPHAGRLNQHQPAALRPKIAANVRSALQWNERLTPFIDRVKEKVNGKDVVKPVRAEGRNVRFREDRPLPDFLTRLAKVSISLPQGNFAGRIENMTSDPDILGLPLNSPFRPISSKASDSASLEGMFDRVDPAARKDVLNLRLRGYEARDVKLVASKSLPVDLAEGLADLDVSASLENGILTARITAGVRSARLTGRERRGASGPGRTRGRGHPDAITGVTTLNLTAEITGTPEDFELKVRSDLDEVLKAAVGGLVRDQLAGFEGDIQKAIAGEVDGPLGKLGTGLKGLEAVGLDLDALNKKLADLLKK